MQHVEDAAGAAVVEHGDRGRTRVEVEKGAGGGRALVLGEPAGHDADLVLEPVAAHRDPIAAPAVGGAGSGSAVDVGDPAVAEAGEVVDGLVHSDVVGGTDYVERRVAGRSGDDDHREAGRASAASSAVGARGAEQDQCLAAVVQQAGHGAALVAAAA